jgi:hypothetical protein
MLAILSGTADASLVYETGTVTAVYGNMIQMIGRNFKLLDNAPVRLHINKGNGEAEIKGSRSDIRPGSVVQLHVAGHLVVDVLIERR